METDFDSSNLLWIGLVTTANVPRPIVDRLNGEMNRILQFPDVRQRFDQLGLDLEGGTPGHFEQFTQRHREEIEKASSKGKTREINLCKSVRSVVGLEFHISLLFSVSLWLILFSQSQEWE